MRKRILFVALVLALVLTSVMPMTALAAKPVPFEAIGGITSISKGEVMPAGQSGRWRVIERELTVNLFGDIGGVEGIESTMTYKANVELSTQAGNLHGTLEAGSYVAKVNGKIEPIEFADWYLPPGTPGYPDGIPLYKLTIGGHWAFTDGAKGQGDFEGWVVFIPTPQGHVSVITGSAFTMTGKWQQP
ncbi:MAG: hypothetical protein KKF26_03100 [Chloroflexi bacterium]|nr:hypothetical protein [Chloroflexota bacterium]